MSERGIRGTLRPPDGGMRRTQRTMRVQIDAVTVRRRALGSERICGPSRASIVADRDQLIGAIETEGEIARWHG